MFKYKNQWLKIFGTAAGILFALPILYTFIKTYTVWQFESSQKPTLKIFSTTAQTIAEPLARSLLLASSVSTATAFLGTLLAIITRRDIPFRKATTALLILPLAIPSFVGAVAFITSLSPGGGALHTVLDSIGIPPPQSIRGFWPSWFILTLFTYPYVYISVRSRLLSLPNSLEESARILGKSPLQTFIHVTLPNIRPAIINGSTIVFLYCLSEFGAVNFLRYDTLTRVIYENRFENLPTFTSATVLFLTAAIVVQASSPSKTNQLSSVTQLVQPSTPRKIQQILSISVVWLTILFSLVIPISGLALWAWKGMQQVQLSFSDLLSTTTSTILVGVITAAITMILILPIAFFTLYQKNIPSRFTRISILAGYATPGIIIALALVKWTINTPWIHHLYGGFTILFIAYFIHFGSLGLGAAETALQAIPNDLKESARLLTESNKKRWLRIHLPLMKPGLLSGAGLVLLATIKELPATLLIAPTNFSTLATDIWQTFEFGSYSQTGLLSIVLVTISGSLTWFLVVRNQEQ